MRDSSPRWSEFHDIVDRVGKRELDPQSVVETHLDAINRFDSRIHAYVYVDRQAKSEIGPTLAVKDSQPVSGMPWTYATPSWKDRVAEEDAVPVRRARQVGLGILGKTNLPELAAAIGTTNTLYPATQNPWRVGITPGGSSGGSAAAVAAGMATVALGEDMGGSVRIPASCCGVVGMRPVPGSIPTEMIDASGLESRGVLGRTVDDVRALYAVAAAKSRWTADGSISPRTVGVPLSTGLGADAACRDACRRAADELTKQGHRLEEMNWDPEPVAQGYGTVRRVSMANFPADISTFGPGIRNLAEQGRDLTARDYFRAFESATTAAIKSIVIPLQERFDFLLTPTLGMLPMKIEDVPPFLGEAWSRYVQFVLPVSFSKLPSVSIPAGLHDGLPIGVQLVGKIGAEKELLDFAEEIENLPGFGFQRPPGLD
ncbi:MAG TPA: amidase [Candidatus Dormibacteraeota bacterium]|nr:amidase [Candidatus Dormibacteraeota bacterium]